MLRRVCETAAFVLLAAAVHVAAGIFISAGPSAPVGPSAAARTSVAMGDARLARIVGRWDRPPLPSSVQAPQQAIPRPDKSPVNLPIAEPRPAAEETLRTPPELPLAAERAEPSVMSGSQGLPFSFGKRLADASDRGTRSWTLSVGPTRPKRRPEPVMAKPSTATGRGRTDNQVPNAAPRKLVGSAETGGAKLNANLATQPGTGSAQTPGDKMGAARRASLMGQWGGQINACLNRHATAPHGVRGSAQVALQLTVSRNGTIISAAVSGSSGSAAFDRAALSVAERAGRCPPAPAGLTQPSYTFRQSLRLREN